MRDTVLRYLNSKGYRHKLVASTNGEQALLRICPLCNDKGGTHFYISTSTGFYYCHKCGARGSLLTLKKSLGDLAEPMSFATLAPPEEEEVFGEEDSDKATQAHLELLEDKETLLYLATRQFSTTAIRHFNLGLSVENGIKWLWFPYYSKGVLKNVKMRTLPPAKKGFKRLLGGESSLYNADILDQKLDYVIIAEGESDTVALWSKGFQNIVGVPIGAGGIKTEWIDLLDKFGKIILVYDNDDAGHLGAQKFAARLGIERCFQVRFPVEYNDVNDYFMKGKTANDFKVLLDNAEPFDVEHVQSLGSLIQQTIRKLYTGITEEKLTLPWPKVNKLLDGFMPGDLIAIAGKPGVGKSTFAFNILYHFAMAKIPSLLISLEMPPWRILPRLIALHKRRDSRLCSDISALADTYAELREVPFYLAHKYDKPTWDFVADTVRNSVRRYGIQFLVFDNLHFLCRSLNRQTEEVSVMIQNFKLLAQEVAIPIVVIARPRKTHMKVISGEDLKDSADIEGDSDIILILHRDRKKTMSGEEIEGNFEAQTLVIADKVRYSPGGSVYIYAYDNEARFAEV